MACAFEYRRIGSRNAVVLGDFRLAFRIDELPQCLNILKGDMSLVGPRPEMAVNVATFAGSSTSEYDVCGSVELQLTHAGRRGN